MKEKMEANIKTFEGVMSKVSRNGIDGLMNFIRKSDFYTAPASTRFHGAYEGGLLEHSLNVYDRLFDKKKNDPFWSEKLKGIPDESIAVIGFLHDICKTYFYTTEMRNKKVNGEWTQVPYYTVDDKIPLGHGEKSVMMISEYISLTPPERYAIRWHMGAYVGQQDWNTLSAVYERYPIVLATHEADMEATYIVEGRNG